MDAAFTELSDSLIDYSCDGSFMPPQMCAGVTQTEVKRPKTSHLTADEIQSRFLILLIRIWKIRFNFKLQYREFYHDFKV